MKHVAPAQLERAVVAVYEDVTARLAPQPSRLCEARILWHELAACLLSSQVPFEMALGAAQAVLASRLLDGGAPVDLDAAVAQVLKRPLLVNGRVRHYRFPTSKGRQLAATVQAVEAAGGLVQLMGAFPNAITARAWFVGRAPGFGPKQASMFLRNVGYSYDVAILDRHVLDYMAALGLCQEAPRTVSRLADYLMLEARLKAHAEDLGFRVGLLDRAIWIVMRVARRERGPGGYA